MCGKTREKAMASSPPSRPLYIPQWGGGGRWERERAAASPTYPRVTHPLPHPWERRQKGGGSDWGVWGEGRELRPCVYGESECGDSIMCRRGRRQAS